jgi:hypothetical protein
MSCIVHTQHRNKVCRHDTSVKNYCLLGQRRRHDNKLDWHDPAVVGTLPFKYTESIVTAATALNCAETALCSWTRTLSGVEQLDGVAIGASSIAHCECWLLYMWAITRQRFAVVIAMNLIVKMTSWFWRCWINTEGAVRNCWGHLCRHGYWRCYLGWRTGSEKLIVIDWRCSVHRIFHIGSWVPIGNSN